MCSVQHGASAVQLLCGEATTVLFECLQTESQTQAAKAGIRAFRVGFSRRNA